MEIEGEGEGMVAVVRGLRDAGLAVTLVDAGRQYSLVPDQASRPCSVGVCQTTGARSSGETSREHGVQATDGRYASVYKMMHCHVSPTSPPQLVTEFPPQRAEIYPGHGNFEVGGPGSGQGHCSPTRCSGFRGAMWWSDRGAVFSPRPSVQDDFFANSLRKYPSLTQDRSSEIMERLISFTQTKNCYRNKTTSSPVHEMESLTSTRTHASRTHRYEHDGTTRPRRMEESPTKERARQAVVQHETSEPWRRAAFSKTSDVRFMRDVTRKVRDGIRHLANQSNNQSDRSTKATSVPPSCEQRSAVNQCSTNTVNMEIQVAVPMVSREVATVAGDEPTRRTVAVPLTSTALLVTKQSESSVSCSRDTCDLHKIKCVTETAHTKLAPVDTVMQTVSSAVEISNHKFRNRKRSRSQEEITLNEFMKHDILDLIRPLYSCCAKTKMHRKLQKRLNRNNMVSVKLDDENKSYYNTREGIHECGFSKADSRFIKRSFAKIFHAEVNPYIITNDDDLTHLLEEWINLIPLKRTDSITMSYNKDFLFYDLFGYLKYAAGHLRGIDQKYKLKSEIINRLESIPLDVRGNRRVFENRIADILVNKIKRIRNKQTHHFLVDNNSAEDLKNFMLTFKRFKTPSEYELKNFVLKKLLLFLKRWELKLNQRQIKGIEDELTGMLLVSVDSLHCVKDKQLKINITELLTDYGISEDQAILFANTLIRNFRNIYIDNMEPAKGRSETFIVLSNSNNVNTNGNSCCMNNVSIKSINEDDIQANLEYYTNDLCRQIDEWLTQLPISILQDKAFRQVVINDLAGDIVDRLRYLESNPSISSSEEIELEHLKYQIFKWINKLVSDDNMEITNYAPELMRRIKDIPVPMLSGLADFNSTKPSGRQNAHVNSGIQFTSIPLFDKSLPRNQETVPLNNTQERCMNPSCSNNNETQNSNSDVTNEIAKTLKDLEDEYEQYVKDWVQLIPIEAKTPEELAIAEKARLGIHYGLWKVISKLNCDPATYYNRFFYEDLIDEGIDDLLDCLPQTPELLSKKHLLKVRFIEKTTEINDLIRANEEASYKHNLIKNIFNNLRQQGLTNLRGDDPVKIQQDMQVKKIVEEFLLCTNFKNDDKVKAEVYKKKLFKHIEDFIEDLKQHHPRELKDIDISSYKTDIINILLKVRLPSEEIIKQEADSILLDLEIEQWYNDLPIAPSKDFKEQYQRSKQREILANKVKDFEKDNSQLTENALRAEVSKFLEKTPLKGGENLNVNFMSDQFVNRIKNRPKQENANKAAYQSIPNYEDFSKEISFCSSFINAPKAPIKIQEQHDSRMNKSKQCSKSVKGQEPNASTNNIKQEHVSSKVVTNRSRVVIHDPPAYRTFNEGRPISSSYREERSPEWMSLDESQPNIGNIQHFQNKHMVTLPPYSGTEDVRPQIYEKNINLQHTEQQNTNRTLNDLNKTRNLEQVDYKMVSENNQNISNKEQLYLGKSNDNRYSERTKSSRGILGTSQIAGPSGYTSQNVNNAGLKVHGRDTEGTCQLPGGSNNVSRAQSRTEPTPSNLEECSCQTFDKNKSGLKIDDDVSNKEDNQMHVSTNTLSGDPCCDQSMFSYSQQDACPGSSETRRRASQRTRERDAVRRRPDYEEDDDVGPCHCVEKYWRRPKRYPCEALDNLPPCLSLLFPYPYFF